MNLNPAQRRARRRLARRLPALSLGCAVLWMAGCSSGGSGGQGENATQVPVSGGAVALEGIATATFPAGSFTSPQPVRLEKTSDPGTAALFEARGPLYAAGARGSYEVRINTGNARPAAAVHASLSIPAGLTYAAGERAQVFVQAIHGNESDVIDGFDWIPSTADAAASRLDLDLTPDLFTWLRTADQSFEAVLLIAAAGEIAGPVSMQALPNALRSTACPKDVRSVRNPREGMVVKSGFNTDRDNSAVGMSKGHPAVDLVASDGDPVVSAGDGTVTAVSESNGKSGVADNGGCGGTIIVSIPGVGNVGYCHLKSGSITVKKGDKVKAGQQMAQSDNTGASTGAHLHFVYVPAGKGPIDPMLCVDSGYDGTVTVKQTGPVSYTAQGEAHQRLRLDDGAGSFYEISGTITISAYETATETCTFSPSSGPLQARGTSSLEIYKKTLSASPYDFVDDRYELSFAATWSATQTCTNKQTGKVSVAPSAVPIAWLMLGQDCATLGTLPLTDRDHLKDTFTTTCGGLTTVGSWDLQKAP